jgi:hypothetical protein
MNRLRVNRGQAYYERETGSDLSKSKPHLSGARRASTFRLDQR